MSEDSKCKKLNYGMLRYCSTHAQVDMQFLLFSSFSSPEVIWDFQSLTCKNCMIKYTTEVASLELPSYIRIIRSHYQDPYEPVSMSHFGSATASSWTMPKFPLSVGDHFPSSIFGGDTLCSFTEFPHQQ